MKELLGLIKQFSEKDLENLTLIKLYQLWKPQIVDIFEKKVVNEVGSVGRYNKKKRIYRWENS